MTTMTSIEDPPTAEYIWREFGTQLRAFVHRRIADPQRADDVIGEVLLRVHQHLGQLDEHDQLTAWVYRIARNAIIDDYRRAAREQARLVPIPDDAPDELPEVSDGEQPAVLRELSSCLRPLLTGLPAEQRRAVQLTDLDGLTQARAAELEGVSLSGMKSRVQRGRRRLAALLDACCALTLDGRGMPMDYTPTGRHTVPGGCSCAGRGSVPR
jgi:RNA polymerase sigma-70 factor, ECF subfamily